MITKSFICCFRFSNRGMKRATISSIISMNFTFFVNNEAIGFGTIPILCLNISSKILLITNFLKARILRSLNKYLVGSRLYEKVMTRTHFFGIFNDWIKMCVTCVSPNLNTIYEVWVHKCKI